MEHRRVSARVAERARRDFRNPEVAETVIEVLEAWGNATTTSEVDRVQAAIVLRAAGDFDEALALIAIAYRDYRDALMATGYADRDWRTRMDVAFRARRDPARWRGFRAKTRVRP